MNYTPQDVQEILLDMGWLPDPTRDKLVWGAAGHEWEWMLILRSFTMGDHYIPPILGKYLKERFPLYYVLDRGSRIEIHDPDGTREDVVAAVREIFPDIVVERKRRA